MRFKLPGDEASGAYHNGETWRIEAKDHVVDVTDEEIAETLQRLADDPDQGVSIVKGK